MIKLNGKYSTGADEFIECEVVAKNGYLLIHTKTDVTQLQKHIESPKNTDVVNIKPSFSKKGIFQPAKHNYIIEYIGEDEKEHLIFVKMNRTVLFLLNHSLKKNVYQTQQLKTNIIGGLIAGLLVLFLTIYLNKTYQQINADTIDETITPDNVPSLSDSLRSSQENNINRIPKNNSLILSNDSLKKDMTSNF